MTTVNERLARRAYFIYGEEVGFRNFQGDPMPEWDQLPDRTRKAWVAVARFLRRTTESTLDKP